MLVISEHKQQWRKTDEKRVVGVAHSGIVAAASVAVTGGGEGGSARGERQGVGRNNNLTQDKVVYQGRFQGN